jgi:Protein of unknown function (DUF1810)
MTDSFDLQRFLDAQEPVYLRVLAELRRGQKQSHWMWFIFLQLAGLGHSAMAGAPARQAQPRWLIRAGFCARVPAQFRGTVLAIAN